jgi:hypothetical protein
MCERDRESASTRGSKAFLRVFDYEQYETVYVLRNLCHFVFVRVDMLASCEHFVFWPAFYYLSALINVSKALPTPARLLI